jgi:hypothetical protein
MGIENIHYVMISNSYATMVAVWVELATASIILASPFLSPNLRILSLKNQDFPDRQLHVSRLD